MLREQWCRQDLYIAVSIASASTPAYKSVWNQSFDRDKRQLLVRTKPPEAEAEDILNFISKSDRLYCTFHLGLFTTVFAAKAHS